MPPTSTEIRQQFLDFFTEKHGHTFAPSSPVVPHDDKTLLFANAGMNQFKDVFLGTGSRDYSRATNTQKCIRAGGKHNDLDDVGKDTYHHTFFEMLGNWSFGDYFKREAIEWAWELLTGVWKLDATRLHVTVFEGDEAAGVPRDDEAARLWKEQPGVDPARIHLGNKKDNFWEMGNTGPCGPCTEVHIDRTSDKSGSKLVNQDSDQCIEIWNLVFIQYNRNEDGSLTPLPAKHVDTGMGFERIAAVLQNKPSNYDTDVFTPLFDAIQKVTKAAPYSGKLDDNRDFAYRVIADHLRMATFALTDGAEPSNVGRGYVVRSVIRRAERVARQFLGMKEPFLHELVPTLIDHMAGAFPELKSKTQRVIDTIKDEEKSFIRTYEKGFKLFQDVVQKTRDAGGTVISGEAAVELHTTHGFFRDITEQMALENGLTVDAAETDRLMEEHQKISQQGQKSFTVTAVRGELPATDDTPKYTREPCDAQVVGWVQDNEVIADRPVPAGESVALLLDRTPFYAEQGGQVGDAGEVRTPAGTFTVEDTQRLGGSVLHVGTLGGQPLKIGTAVTAEVTGNRLDTMRNHTATHMLNFALREVLGDHVEQKGSLVNGEKTRFDFSHPEPLTPEEIRQIEQIVNEQIARDLPVGIDVIPLEEAQKLPGVRAVFGEKYPDPVRVVSVGAAEPRESAAGMSVEFCGGTHLERTSQAGLFKVLSQELVSKGVRRLTAVTGTLAFSAVRDMSAVVDDLSAKLNCKTDELPARVEALQAEVKKLQTQLKKGASVDLGSAADKLYDSAEVVGNTRLLVGELPAGPVEQIRTQMDRLRQKSDSAFITLIWNDDGKVGLLVALTNDLVGRGLSASELIRPVAEALGGKGGGKRPDMAQAGGKDPAKIPAGLAKAAELAKEKLA